MSMIDIPDNIVNLPDRVKALENQITSLSNHPEYVADAVISKSLQSLSNSINDSKKDILTAKILQKSAQDRKILDINLDKNNTFFIKKKDKICHLVIKKVETIGNMRIIT